MRVEGSFAEGIIPPPPLPPLPPPPLPPLQGAWCRVGCPGLRIFESFSEKFINAAVILIRSCEGAAVVGEQAIRQVGRLPVCRDCIHCLERSGLLVTHEAALFETELG